VSSSSPPSPPSPLPPTAPATTASSINRSRSRLDAEPPSPTTFIPCGFHAAVPSSNQHKHTLHTPTCLQQTDQRSATAQPRLVRDTSAVRLSVDSLGSFFRQSDRSSTSPPTSQSFKYKPNNRQHPSHNTRLLVHLGCPNSAPSRQNSVPKATRIINTTLGSSRSSNSPPLLTTPAAVDGIPADFPR
jgi:hypothetical protein